MGLVATKMKDTLAKWLILFIWLVCREPLIYVYLPENETAHVDLLFLSGAE